MIIYGSRATQLAKETIAVACPHCENNHQVDMYVFQRYAHVFWIPFVPIGKTGVSQCGHCKQTLKFKDMPQRLRVAYQEIAKGTKVPAWTFAGVAFVGALIIYSMIQSGMKDAQTSKLLQAPQTGDLIEVRKSAGLYTIYKVSDVRTDSVAVLPMRYSVNQQAGLMTLAGTKYQTEYDNEPKMYTREMLTGLLRRGEILDVIRR